ncbi:MAG: DNA-protecting protein DprA [Deltaproteobacteria bacterium]|nr:DNA-protecting protein DprA [Deltaproteobacteria bacterium]
MVEAWVNFPEELSLPARAEKGYAPWLAFASIKGLGCIGFKKLVEYFGDPTKAFAASVKELAEIPGMDREAAAGLQGFDRWSTVEDEVERVLESGVKIVPFNAREYPPRLRMIPDPPPFLYAKGELRPEDERAVALVGSRSASEYGLRIARDLSQGLAALGFTVVSGMALGIDGEAHRGALGAEGRSLAVLGCGVDIIYPPDHEELYRSLCERGAILSELPLGTRPFAFNFPSRNRLISGVALGVVVVEATEKSGSLITAGLAAEQGREVFAVPGEAGASRSRGTHRLIRQGAKLVESVQDIVEEIAPQLLGRIGAVAGALERPAPVGLSGEARKVFELVAVRPLQIDEVIEKSGLTAARVSELLLELEIRGLVRQLAGKRFTVN